MWSELGANLQTYQAAAKEDELDREEPWTKLRHQLGGLCPSIGGKIVSEYMCPELAINFKGAAGDLFFDMGFLVRQLLSSLLCQSIVGMTQREVWPPSHLVGRLRFWGSPETPTSTTLNLMLVSLGVLYSDAWLPFLCSTSGQTGSHGPKQIEWACGAPDKRIES